MKIHTNVQHIWEKNARRSSLSKLLRGALFKPRHDYMSLILHGNLCVLTDKPLDLKKMKNPMLQKLSYHLELWIIFKKNPQFRMIKRKRSLEMHTNRTKQKCQNVSKSPPTTVFYYILLTSKVTSVIVILFIIYNFYLSSKVKSAILVKTF